MERAVREMKVVRKVGLSQVLVESYEEGEK